MVNVSSMMASTTAAQLALNKSIRKTYNGTEIDINDEQTMVRYFKFTSEDIGKYIVVKFRYEEHMGWGSIFGVTLKINYNKLSTQNNDSLYGVYKIDWHDDYQKSQNDVSYKIKLTPVANWGAWCPNRSWYTSDIESIINKEYNLFDENPLFDSEYKATAFAMKKNFELYPDTRSMWQKIKDKIFNR